MARQDFIDQLTALGYAVEDLGENRLAINYDIPIGKYIGQQIKLGFIVPDDFPMNPPSGPHISPQLLPLHPGQDIPHPVGGVHSSPSFGDEWQYWSRPYTDWASSDRTVRAYLGHIKRLFETQ